MSLSDAWHGIPRVLLAALAAYVGVVILLRAAGKRTLASMHAFDLVVSVALGSVIASAILLKDVTLLDGLAAVGVLVGAQFLVAFLQIRITRFRALVSSEPALLFHQGHFRDDAMRRERVARGEVLAAVRSSGAARLDDVEAVVLESDGSFSVVRRPQDPSGRSSLADVRGIEGSSAAEWTER